jgi:hypothetical protein
VTTLADVIAECRRYLMTGTREARNTLNGAIASTSSTSFTFTYDLGGINVGSRLSVDLEDVYVYAVSQGTKTATVGRGDNGSTAATHSDGAKVLVNPRFSDYEIFAAINHELQVLSSPSNGLFQVKTVDLTYNGAVDGYDLSSVTDLIQVTGVRYAAVGSSIEYPLIDPGLWEHARNLDTAVFASGQALFMRGAVDPGRTMRVSYKAPFVALANLTDNVATVSKLHAEAHDILSLGAAIRLTAGREVHRNFDEVQGNTRRAGEVPPGANLGANRGLQQQYFKRVNEEKARLGVMYPMRTR